MAERKGDVFGTAGNVSILLDGEEERALLTEDEVLHGLSPDRVAELLFGLSPDYIRRLKQAGRIIGTGKKGRYTARSVLLERRRRQREAGHPVAEAA